MNLISFDQYEPFNPKYHYGELFDLISKAPQADQLLYRRKFPSEILSDLHKFSVHAVKAERLLR